MTSMRDDELDRALDRSLAQLPAPRAPRTLLPRVMAAVAQPAAPWYARPWLSWHPGLQTVSLLGVLAAVSLVWMAWARPEAVFAQVSAFGPPQASTWASAVASRVSQITAVVSLLWDVVLGPIAIFVFAVALFVALACAAAWTAVSRVALGGADSQ
jgi:hypothetical protein